MLFRTILSFPLMLMLGGCPTEPTTQVEEDCTLLCDRTVLCTESHVAPLIAAGDSGNPDEWACAFDDPDAARATCQAGCVEAGKSPVTAECIQCLGDNMSCTTTASMRSCDVDCEPTLFVTGTDFEGAMEYDYATWFFDGVSSLDGITCTQP